MLIVKKDNIHFKDSREINPATGTEWSNKPDKSTMIDPTMLDGLVSESIEQGLNPNLMVAMWLQETNASPDYADNPLRVLDMHDRRNNGESVNNATVSTVLEKLNYARGLRRRGVIDGSNASMIQAYNGLGKLGPSNEWDLYEPIMKSDPRNWSGSKEIYYHPKFGEVSLDRAQQIALQKDENGNPYGMAELKTVSTGMKPKDDWVINFYGVETSKNNPLDLKKNPAYGKYVEELVKDVNNNKGIQDVINSKISDMYKLDDEDMSIYTPKVSPYPVKNSAKTRLELASMIQDFSKVDVPEEEIKKEKDKNLFSSIKKDLKSK